MTTPSHLKRKISRHLRKKQEEDPTIMTETDTGKGREKRDIHVLIKNLIRIEGPGVGTGTGEIENEAGLPKDILPLTKIKTEIRIGTGGTETETGRGNETEIEGGIETEIGIEAGTEK